MSSEVGSSRGSGAVLYGPRISRSLVNQLESQLRTLGLPAIPVPAPPPTVKHCEVSPSAKGLVQLGADQLESALNCVKVAAQAMAELNEQVVGPDERASMNQALSGLERRLHAFEREVARMAGKLQDARRETEEHRQRSLAAETKLESLLAAVAKMIAPLGSASAARQARSQSVVCAALLGDEVTI